MSVQIKDRATAEKANAYRAKAAELRAKVLDESVQLTKDELLNIESEMKSLEHRASLVAGFTPENEIASQGGEGELVTRSAPHAEGDETSDDYRTQVDAIRKQVRKEFGGPNAMILSLAQRSLRPLNARQAKVIERLEALTQRTITGVTGNASNAEVLLPLQQEESIFQVPVEVGGMFQFARRYTVRGRSLRIPYLVQSDATGSSRPMAGIADVVIVGEGGEKTSFEPKFDQRLLIAYKYAGYTEIGDETLSDDMTGDLAPTVQGVIGGQIINKINEDITFDGTGSSQPLGAFHPNNASMYKVARKTASSFKVEDAFNMYARHVLGPQSAWFIHPSVMPQLMNLSLSGTTLVSFVTNLQGRPQMQLLGLPIIVTPLMAVLGLQGDVALGNGAFYAMALRQALTIESSIHYRFRNDITAYRFFARGGGIPIPTATYSYKAATSVKEYEVSPFVVLDDVEAS
jgi:HK97 family phage major capsid protein